jgi:hypothetical protein
LIQCQGRFGKMLPSGVPSLANIRYSPYSLPNMSISSGYPISTPSVGSAPVPAQYSVANSILPNSTSAIQSSITSPSSSSISNPSSQSLNMATTLALAGAIPGYGQGYNLANTLDLGNMAALDWAAAGYNGQGLFTLQ